jgi:hypothetical protein
MACGQLADFWLFLFCPLPFHFPNVCVCLLFVVFFFSFFTILWCVYILDLWVFFDRIIPP